MSREKRNSTGTGTKNQRRSEEPSKNQKTEGTQREAFENGTKFLAKLANFVANYFNCWDYEKLYFLTQEHFQGEEDYYSLAMSLQRKLDEANSKIARYEETMAELANHKASSFYHNSQSVRGRLNTIKELEELKHWALEVSGANSIGNAKSSIEKIARVNSKWEFSSSIGIDLTKRNLDRINVGLKNLVDFGIAEEEIQKAILQFNDIEILIDFLRNCAKDKDYFNNYEKIQLVENLVLPSRWSSKSKEIKSRFLDTGFSFETFKELVDWGKETMNGKEFLHYLNRLVEAGGAKVLLAEEKRKRDLATKLAIINKVYGKILLISNKKGCFYFFGKSVASTLSKLSLEEILELDFNSDLEKLEANMSRDNSPYQMEFSFGMVEKDEEFLLNTSYTNYRYSFDFFDPFNIFTQPDKDILDKI